MGHISGSYIDEGAKHRLVGACRSPTLRPSDSHRSAIFVNREVRLDRIVYRALGHREAAEWDIEQHLQMSPDERLRVSRVLKERVYGKDAPDVRACHRLE